LTALLLLMPGTSVSPQQHAEWKDPSAHITTFITVEDGVQLEVLDWGGSGRSIVLLGGLGDTAHVFDEFARLAEDVLRVIDALSLQKP